MMSYFFCFLLIVGKFNSSITSTTSDAIIIAVTNLTPSRTWSNFSRLHQIKVAWFDDQAILNAKSIADLTVFFTAHALSVYIKPFSGLARRTHLFAFIKGA